jgi:hypothetical protein
MKKGRSCSTGLIGHCGMLKHLSFSGGFQQCARVPVNGQNIVMGCKNDVVELTDKFQVDVYGVFSNGVRADNNRLSVMMLHNLGYFARQQQLTFVAFDKNIAPHFYFDDRESDICQSRTNLFGNRSSKTRRLRQFIDINDSGND